MNTAATLPFESSTTRPVAENGWYLLRRNVFLSDRLFRAGTLVEHVDGEWFLRVAEHDALKLVLAPELVCKTHYHGVFLYEVECKGGDAIYARPVLSDTPAIKVEPSMVHISLTAGGSRVCVKFGRCFLSLELFNW